MGQTDDPQVFELSPFAVEADADIGYMPVSTLAGTRLRTEFRDLSASTDGLTLEFLDDIGAVTMEEGLLYTAHVETPYELAQDSIYGPGPGSNDLRIGSGTRALGLTKPTYSKNYFRALLPVDRYNTERIIIARGPQAILFGLGSPSGIINTNQTTATIGSDFFKTKFRFDNWGSVRWQLDLNQELLADKLALRLAYVDDQKQIWLDPCWDNQERKYGTITWKPLHRITVRVHHETFERDANLPGTQLPRDNVSFFLEENNGKPVAEDNPFWIQRNPYPFVSILLNSNGAPGPVFTSLKGYAMVRPAGEIVSLVSDPESPYYDATNVLFDKDWTSIDDSSKTRSLRNEQYYPLKDNYLLGDLNNTVQKGNSINAFMELKLIESVGLLSNGFVELGYHRADLSQVQGGLFGGNDFALKVDPNLYLLNGELNPNVGRFYVDSGNSWSEGSYDKDEELRAIASVELNLETVMPWMGHHRFGLLASEGIHEENQQRAFRNVGNIGGIIGGIKPEAYTGMPMRDSGSNWRHPDGGRRVHVLAYLDLEEGLLYPRADLIPWGGILDTWFVPTDQGSFGIYGFGPEGPGMWQAAHAVRQKIDSLGISWQAWFPLGQIASLVTTAGYREDSLKAKNKVSPGSYLNSFGETLNVRDNTQIEETRYFAHYDHLLWEEDWKSFGSTENDTLGAVLQLDPFMDRLFNGNFRASVNYHSSSNNTGVSKLRTANGELHPGQRGKGENYGLRVEFEQGRYALSINKWFVDLLGAGAAGESDNVRYSLMRIEQRWDRVEPATEEAIVNSTGGYIPDANGVDLQYRPNDYKVYADKAAKGWTLDFVANPTRGLRVRANISQTKAIISNIGDDWRHWIRDIRQPLWSTEMDWWYDLDGNGNWHPVLAWDPNLARDENQNGFPDTMEDDDDQPNLTLGDSSNPEDVANILSGWDNIAYDDVTIDQSVRDYYLLMVEANYLIPDEGREGLSNPNIREWRMNLSAAYTIQSGRLRNLRLGGSIRYRDKPFVGSGARTVTFTLGDGSKLNVTTNDPMKPLFGEAFWFLDLMMGYSGKLKGKSGLDYSLQLNIRNALNESGTYTTAATAAGKPVRMAQNIPREFFLSARIDF